MPEHRKDAIMPSGTLNSVLKQPDSRSDVMRLHLR
jgi:hypothetical protein